MQTYEKFEEIKYMISLIQTVSKDLQYGDISYLDDEWHEYKDTKIGEEFFTNLDILESRVKTLRDWVKSYNSDD